MFVISSCVSQAQDEGHGDGGDKEKRRDQGNMSAPKVNPPNNPSQNQPENQPQREDSPTNSPEKPPEENPPAKPPEEDPPEKPSDRKHCDDCDDYDYWWLSLASWMDFGSGSNSWSNADRWGVSYYLSQINEAPGIIIDESVSSQYPPAVESTIDDGQNVLQIVSIDGSINWGSIDMPQYHYARLLIIPSTDGQLNLEEMCPNGEIRYYNLGDVSADHQYRLWKYSDSEGSHLLRYRIDDYYNYSDTVRIYVN